MKIRQTVKDTVVCTAVGVAAERAIHYGGWLVRATVGAFATLSCHNDAMKLLSEWAKYAPAAKDTEVPGELMLKTLTMLRNHRRLSVPDIDVTALFYGNPNGTEAGATKPPVPEQSGTDREENKTGG